MSRRGFLAGTAAVAVPCFVPGSVLGMNGRAAANGRIRIGHIGVGGQGSGHVGAMVGDPSVQVMAICDPFQSKREANKKRADDRYAAEIGKGTYQGCADYSDFRDLVTRDDIDAVIIASPEFWHARVYQLGTQQRSDRNFRFAAELAINGYLGKLHTVQVSVPGGSGLGVAAPAPVPPGLDYEMWLGPAPYKPYNNLKCSFNWYFIYDYCIGWIGSTEAAAALAKAEVPAKALAALHNPPASVRRTPHRGGQHRRRRGYLRLSAQVKDATERLKLLERVRSIAKTVEAKRMLLACLAEAADPGALHVAAAMLDDAAVRAEAEAATLKIARGLVRLDAPAVRAAMKKVADTTKDSAVAEQAAALDEEAAKAPTPGSAERALEHDNQRSDAYKAALARRAPKGYRLACYLDCGPDTSDGVKGGPQLRLVNDTPYFWNDSDRVADVRFGSGSYDNQRVVFEAGGLSPKKRYQIGFSWWDFDHDTRVQSVWLAAGKGGSETNLLEKTKLPSGVANQPPDIKTLPIPPGLLADGPLEIIFRNEAAPNVIVSEIWLWESDTDAGSSAGPYQ